LVDVDIGGLEPRLDQLGVDRPAHRALANSGRATQPQDRDSVLTHRLPPASAPAADPHIGVRPRCCQCGRAGTSNEPDSQQFHSSRYAERFAESCDNGGVNPARHSAGGPCRASSAARRCARDRAMASVTAALASQAGLGGGDGLALHASFHGPARGSVQETTFLENTLGVFSRL
jgi:hypothetical protein